MAGLITNHKRLACDYCALGLVLAMALALVPSIAFATSAPVVAPCVSLSTTSSGVTIESCQPVTPTYGLPVNIVAGGGGGLSVVDGAAFAAGTSDFTPNGGVYQSSATSNPLTAGKQGTWQLTQYRAGMVDWFNSSGTEMGTTGSPVVTNLGQVNGVTTLTGAGATGIGSQRTTVAQDTTTIAGSAPGTAGSASANVVSVQGLTGMTPISENLAQVGGVSTSTNPLMLAPSTAPATATNSAITVDLRQDSPGIITLGPAAVSGGVPYVLSSQYPVNNNTTTPTAETISATGTSSAFTATLAVGSASQTVYICGAEIDAAATAGLAVAATITGTVTGTLNFVEEVSTLTGTGVGRNVYNFNPCIPASAANTSIVVHAGAAGSGGISSISAWGYLL